MILYLKSLFQEKIPRWGFDNINRVAFKNCYRGGQKFLRSTFFRGMLTVSQGGGSQENVSIVSARGVPKWAFLASADMWMTPKPRQKETLFWNPILYSYSPVQKCRSELQCQQEKFKKSNDSAALNSTAGRKMPSLPV